MEIERKVRLYSYKTGEQITTADQLPLLSHQRTSTDVFCTILTSIFALVMFITALVNLNTSELKKMTYPTDSQGRHCTLDNKNFNYLYFPTPNNPAKRLCVASCPKGTESKLDCWPTNQISCLANPNPQFQVIIYATDQKQTSIGLFCLPTDKLVRQKLIAKAQLQNKFDFQANYTSIGISLLSGIGLGLLAILLFSFIPTFITYASIVLGGLGCFILAILLLVSNSDILAVQKTFIIVFSLALIAVGILLFWGLRFNQAEISLSISYIKQASICLRQAPSLIMLSFVFIVLLAGLILLCNFQIFAYQSSSEMVLNPNSIYFQPKAGFATIMSVLTVIQFFWGLCFLKQALNFLVSGIAISWHFEGEHSLQFPLGNLFKYHWGSVAGGAFLLNILYPLDIVYDLIKPTQMSQKTVASSICCCCQRILDLARSQAMAMVNLLGTPYCNSARLCQQIVFYSSYTDGGESANRFVRIGSHILFAGLATLFGWIYAKAHGTQSVIAVTLCFVVNLFNLTFFICVIKDIAQTLFFCDLVHNCLDNKEQISSAMPIQKKLFGEGYEILRTEPK